MSQSPVALRYVVQACHNLESKAAYACLASFLGESQSEPTLKEVMIRSLAVHIISLSAYGHLMSLQGITSAYRRESWRPVVMLLAFFLMPELAVVQLIRRTCYGVVRWFRNRQHPFYFWYYAAISLGCYSSESSSRNDLAALHSINPNNLRYKRKTYNIIWLGRLILLLGLLVQDLGSLGIWYRSYSVYSDHWNTFIHFDLQNFRMVLGGFAVVVNSILITLTNLEWHHEPAEDVQLSSSTHDESLPSHILPTDNFANRPQCSSASIQKKIQIYNDVFEARLGYFFPVEQQHEIEAAIILNTMAVLTKQLLPQFNPHFLSLDAFIEEKTTDDTDPSPLLLNTTSSNARWGLSREGISLNLNGFIFNILPSFASILIIISFWTRYLTWNTWLGRYLPRIRRIIVFCDKWIISGRSAVTFPCFLVFVIYLVVFIPIVRLVWDADVQAYLSSLHSEGTHWDELLVKAYRYKDPWYDNMYVL